MTDTRKKRPRDPAQLAKLMIDIASGEVEDREPTPEEQGKDKGGPQMTKWLSLGSRCAARHPTSVVTCFFFARLLWIIGAQ
jgi:hypothetical protein